MFQLQRVTTLLSSDPVARTLSARRDEVSFKDLLNENIYLTISDGVFFFQRKLFGSYEKHF